MKIKTPKDLALGIDLGTSSVKLLLMNGRREVLAGTKEEYPLRGAEHGYFEQNPNDWTTAVKQALKTMAEQVPDFAPRLSAIGLSGQMPTLVLCTPEGKPLRPAIVWCDNRAEAEGKRLLSLWQQERYYRRTGIVLDGRYLLPMYHWVREHEGIPGDQDYLILSAKDYLALWLTGEAVTDPSTASGYGVYNLAAGRFDVDLLAEASVRSDVLPRIESSQAVIGRLKADLASELGLAPQTPVVNGGADSVLGVLGMGILTEGTVCQMWGSSTAIIAVTNRPVYSGEERFFITPLALDQTFGVEADLLSTGTAFDWLSQLIEDAALAVIGQVVGEISPDRLAVIAEQAPPLADGLLFYPYFAGGEQGVLWDTQLSATVKGISLRHRLPHIVRAFYEGLMLEVRRCLVCFAADGCPLGEIVVTGPVINSPFFLQLLADVTGLPVKTVPEENGSAFGAAVIAGLGGGLLDQADIELLAAGRGACHYPDQARKALYDEAYHRYVINTASTKFKKG